MKEKAQKKEKNNMEISNDEVKFIILTLFVVLALILGVKLSWAKFAYGDFKCAFAECRIIK